MKKSRLKIALFALVALLASCANHFKSEVELIAVAPEATLQTEDSYWPFNDILENSDPYVSELMQEN